MWKIESTGVALWESAGASWRLDARGGNNGIACLGDEAVFQLQPVGDDQLPAAAEQFVRGDQWHVVYPQGDGSYSLHAVFRPVLTDEHRLVLELTLAIQTSLLDTHPMIDLRAAGGRRRCFTPANEAASANGPVSADGKQPAAAGDRASAISRVARDTWAVAVLLGPRDYPWTLDLSSDQEIRLRLFGEFLEKGVIRKARPWIVLEHGEATSDDETLAGLWNQLCETPLPLT